MTIGEKVAYLKGIAEGVDLDAGSKSGKVLSGIIEVLEEIANELQDTTERLDAVDEDLALAEDLLYDDDDLFSLDEDEEDEDEDEDAEEYEFECPSCGETVYLDGSLFNDDSGEIEIECPSCGAKLDGVFDFDDEEEDDDE